MICGVTQSPVQMITYGISRKLINYWGIIFACFLVDILNSIKSQKQIVFVFSVDFSPSSKKKYTYISYIFHVMIFRIFYSPLFNRFFFISNLLKRRCECWTLPKLLITNITKMIITFLLFPMLCFYNNDQYCIF